MSNQITFSIKRESKNIFLFANNGDYIDCRTIHTQIYQIIQNSKEYQEYKDITEQALLDYQFYIFLDSTLLLGSKETPNNPLFFGELDKEGVFIESKPIYHLQVSDEIIESTSNNGDSNNSLSTLDVFLNGSRLTLLNYSLLDSSLNIKLECNSSESKEIQEKEKTMRDCHEANASRNDNPQSTAMLHPILEDNEIKCPHNGVVKLKANKGKPFTSKGIPLVLESDLLNSQILGCTNNIAGVPTPCTSVAVILPSARGLKKFNDDYPIMQDLVASGCLSDKVKQEIKTYGVDK